MTWQLLFRHCVRIQHSTDNYCLPKLCFLFVNCQMHIHIEVLWSLLICKRRECYYNAVNSSTLAGKSLHLRVHLNVMFSFKQCLVVKDFCSLWKAILVVLSQLEQWITYVHFHIVGKVVRWTCFRSYPQRTSQGVIVTGKGATFSKPKWSTVFVLCYVVCRLVSRWKH